jgi:hypothetical protein
VLTILAQNKQIFNNGLPILWHSAAISGIKTDKVLSNQYFSILCMIKAGESRIVYAKDQPYSVDYDRHGSGCSSGIVGAL